MAGVFDGTGTKAGTAGGILLIILANINSGDLLRTAVLATLGAIVSFTVSLFLRTLVERFRKKHLRRR